MRLFRMLNVVNVQCRGYYDDLVMKMFNIVIALMVQRHRFGANISMDVFAIENVFNPQRCVCYDDYSMNVFNIATALMVQRRGIYVNIPMNVSSIMYALMVQLGTSCSFDSPGLARNEPTPGKRSQGDSTPSVLSFFCEGTLTMKHFMTDYTKKPQHLWRCSPQIVH